MKTITWIRRIADHATRSKFALVLCALGAVAGPVRAQYAIDWSTIDGGGGTSTGGVFSISGTIGQPDAGGPSTGGPYSLIGGFWSIASVIQTPGAPLLSVERLPGGGVRIFWPLPANGWLLDQTTALAPAPLATSWNQVVFPYSTNATEISITVPPPDNHRFYRLRKP